MMIKTNSKLRSYLFVLGLCVPALSACGGLHTPSMMNTSPTELSRETLLDQIPLKDINDNTLGVLANEYQGNGNGVLDLTMTYDPKSKEYTAMRALHTLKNVRTTLEKKGVRSVSTQTLAVEGGAPSLMVAYDVVKAHAPSDCTSMPGLDTNETGRFIGDYKFGCGVETMIAKQVARPTDLEGNATLDKRDARRDSIMLEGYASGVPNTRLEGLERDNLSSE